MRLPSQKNGTEVKTSNSSSKPQRRSRRLCSYPDSRRNSLGQGVAKAPTAVHTLESKILKCMEKTPKLTNYDRKGDPDEHVQLIDEQLSYFSTEDTSKYMLFALIMIIPTWLRIDLPYICIDSCVEFCKRFSAYFTVWKRHSTTKDGLTGIIQRKKEI